MAVQVQPDHAEGSDLQK